MSILYYLYLITPQNLMIEALSVRQEILKKPFIQKGRNGLTEY